MPKRKTQEEFERELSNTLGDTYKVLGNYINNHTKVEMYHSICNNTFLKLPKDALRGSGCPFCYGIKPALYNEQWVKENTPLPYHYINGFTTMSEKCNFYCDNCKEIFQQSPRRLILDRIFGCNCSPNKKKTHDDFLQELGEDCLDEYMIIDEYINYNIKIHMRHKTCNTVFQITPDKFISRYNKKYCPVCYYKKSKGEVAISTYLTKNNISYETNFSFNDLPRKRFDFYLPKYNACIEYDGEQHFRAVDYFGGEKGFIDAQRRDKEKNKYCIQNNIQLFRIPFVDLEHIEHILQGILVNRQESIIKKYLINEM